MLGVCLPQLHASRGFAYDALSGAVALMPVGVFLGSSLGGLFSRHLMKHNELLLAFLQPTVTFLALLVPFVPTIWLLCIVFAAQGFVTGATLVGGCIALYEPKSLCFIRTVIQKNKQEKEGWANNS